MPEVHETPARPVGDPKSALLAAIREKSKPFYSMVVAQARSIEFDGETELFAREDAVEAEWRVVDPVLGEDGTPLYEYQPGTWGPEEANQLIAGDGSWSEPS